MAVHRGVFIVVLAALVGAAVAGCGGPEGTPPQFVAEWDSGGARVGKIDHPEGIGVGKQGELIVADTWNDRILRAASEGEVVGAFGEYGSDPGQLQCPRSVATDERGNIYVVDTWNHRVQMFSSTGQFVLEFGSQGGPWGYDEADGKFSYPYDVAVDSSRHIYVSDFNNNRIQKFDPKGRFVKKWGTAGRQDGQFSHPAGLAIDIDKEGKEEDTLYVADLGNGRVQSFNTEGEFTGKFVGRWGEFDRPYDVAVDANGDVYVAEFGAHQVHKFTPSGHPIWSLGERGGGQGELEMPLSVAVDDEGAVYVSDWGNNRIQKFAPAS